MKRSEETKSMDRRYLLDDEKRLLTVLLNKAGIFKPDDWLDSVLITPMNDGGMGSYFISKERYTSIASDVLFLDEDHIEVLASLYVNSAGEPCEVDVWKMNYSKLKRIPPVIVDIRV